MEPGPSKPFSHSVFDVESISAHNSWLENTTRISCSKNKLIFNCHGSECPVVKLGEPIPPDKVVWDKVELSLNMGSTKYHWSVSQQEDNPKFHLEVNPPEGKLRKGKPVTIQFGLAMFCTTKIRDFKLAIHFTDSKKKKLPTPKGGSRGSMSTASAPPTVLLLSFNADSELSASIDFDEIQPLEIVGKGSFGAVHKALWRGQVVACKVLHVQDMTPEDRAVFQRELLMMTKLRSPYVVALYGYTQVPTQKISIVMEYFSEGSLLDLIKKQISEGMRIKVVLDIATGMNFLHKSNIFHRDLKPDNILVASSQEGIDGPNIRIADFDAARSFFSEDYAKNYQSFVQCSLTKTEAHFSGVGTIPYKAPEVMEGTTAHLDAVDIFSFGSLMYHVFTNVQPFGTPEYKDFDVSDIEQFIVDGKRIEVPSSVPPEIRDLIKECWKHDPKQRPRWATIIELLQSLLGTASPLPPPAIQKQIGWVGKMDRKEATELLTSLPAKTFLIRSSERARGSYVMSYKTDALKVGHLSEIRAENGKIVVTKENKERKFFDSLLAYVEAMKQQNIITTPIKIEQTAAEPDDYLLNPSII